MRDCLTKCRTLVWEEEKVLMVDDQVTATWVVLIPLN